MCEYCDIIMRNKETHIIFEDQFVLAFLPENASALGEIILVPKQHVQILEQLSDTIISHIAIITKQLSDISFEILSGQGTNILIQNGVPAGQEIPHVAIHIYPRRKGDGLQMEWDTKRASDSDLASAKNILGQETKNIFVSVIESKQKKIIFEPKKTEKILSEEKTGEIDYRLDFLKKQS